MAWESLWVTWKRHQHRLGYVIAGLLLFAAGWQLGRTTSPYYAASPIVFQEAPGVAAEANNGSPEALVALRDAGLKKDTVPAQVAAATTASPSLGGGSPVDTVGESALPSPTTGASGAPTVDQKVFAGSKNSNLYHHKECASVASIKPENIIWWPTKEAAEAAGYKPSKCTQERLGQ